MEEFTQSETLLFALDLQSVSVKSVKEIPVSSNLVPSGPALSGTLVEYIGFRAMLIGIGLISIIYGPLLLFLKNPPPRTEQEKQETTVILPF
jgi:hypothetical protein